MKLHFALYRRNLAVPFRYGEKEVSTRDGICLRLETPDGDFYSEASPLAGHSRETLLEVAQAINALGTNTCCDLAMGETEADDETPPSLLFALEGLRAQILWKLSGGKPVRSNALIPWKGVSATLEEVWEKKAEGYSVVKLKVLEGHTNEMLELLTTLEGKGIQVRLDANRSLHEGTLKTFFAGLEKLSPTLVDYLEEPFSHWRHPLLERAPVPLAADECAADPRFWRALLATKNGPSVFILKPTVNGGLFSLASKAKELQANGKRIVYTSALEAEPGRRALISFLSLEGISSTAGLSTGFLYKENYMADLALRDSVPEPGVDELTWLQRLPWQKVP